MCSTRLAGNTGRKNDAKNRHLCTIAQLCRAISSQLRHVSTIGKKNLLSSNISSTCPHNMVNFGPLAAEIVSLFWDTPGNFNGFRVLAALLHGSQVVRRQPNFAALNRGRHLWSAGRPSRWALAYILVSHISLFSSFCCRSFKHSYNVLWIVSNNHSNQPSSTFCRKFFCHSFSRWHLISYILLLKYDRLS